MSIISHAELTQLESNLVRLVERVNTPDASPVVKGKIQIAKSEEVKRGVEHSKTVTPLGLSEALADKDSNISKKIVEIVAYKLEQKDKAHSAEVARYTKEVSGLRNALFELNKKIDSIPKPPDLSVIHRSVAELKDRLDKQSPQQDLSGVYKAIADVARQKTQAVEKQVIDENILASIVEKMLVKMLSENKANVLDEIVAGILTNKTHLSNMKGAMEK